ncbi:hydrogenase 4 subunit F [Orbus wheelerorum]|uniref:hydrogenase 4 subunit F n=1 Tax=Orbus wheelerorum TaxID=3074111 RepID=UPI00370D983C
MNGTEIIYLLLATPLLFATLAFLACLLGKLATSLVTLINFIGVLVLLILSGLTVYIIFCEGQILSANLWWHVDALSGIFIALLGIIGFITAMYSIGYMNHELRHGEISVRGLCCYYGFFQLFLFTMLLAITTNNLIVMWVAIEATTLSSTFLVGLYGQKSSLEAAWKYIIICTIGVAFGLYGTVLVYADAASLMTDPSLAVFWTEVVKYPEIFDPTLMHIAFVFILLGFGTKMGLFPMHAWLPDAHSEAPSPASALLSAVLLNCALLVVLRYFIIIAGVIGDSFPKMLLLILGFLSVGFAAFFIIVQRDIKRLLAYSSVENMGLIAIAIAIGGPLGTFAALLHTINHSLAKTLLFCGSGNILLKYGTRDMSVVKGLLKIAPITSVLFIAGALALGGMPPFNVFVSEFMLVIASIQSGSIWLTVLLLLLLTVVLGGLVKMAAKVSFGVPPEAVSKGELGFMAVAPMAILLALMLLMGTYIPPSVKDYIHRATEIIMISSQFELVKASEQPLHNQINLSKLELVSLGQGSAQ